MTRGTLVLVIVLGCGCGKARPLEGDQRSCATWNTDIEPMFQEHCAGCHAGASPAGSYDTTSYLGALGGGSDEVPNLVAGDAASLVIAKLEEGVGPHAGFADLVPLVRSWVVDCRLAFSDSPVHQAGILNPADTEEFHGSLLRQVGWQFDRCAICHGEDFSGGTSGVSCLSCHASGPTACETCHTKTLRNGAHAAHKAKGLDCSECHGKPTAWTDVGHIFLGDGSLDPSPAEVTFGLLAGTTPSPTDRAGPPAWDGSSGTCSNVYCHGDAFADASATNTRPRWTGGSAEAACGTCHGQPPSSHAQSQCTTCHDADAPHVNGMVEIGDGSGGCSACHGTAGNPAPPRDLDGATLTSALGVGAHASHLEGPHRLRGPIACTDCHQVPTTITDAGHIDSDRPADVTFAGLAIVGGSTPIWDRASATCSGTYCHGSATPVWTSVGTGQATCGTCHAIPPATAAHNPGILLTDCVLCHPATVDAFGSIRVTGGTSTHMNGVVDAP